ncbi:MAG: sodium:alanine symporter family protein, partial [Verrucomicrobiae bacterium]|nr:sodium:alanine symporter family protein [Verrucomicrobiae bacterium]
MDQFKAFLQSASGIIWGPPLLALLVGTGIYLTIRLRLIQVFKLGTGLRIALGKEGREHRGEGDVTQFQSLMTALAATIGVGNIVGVATAVSTGGPGAIFWLWVIAFVGMATKYAEGLLAVKFRVKD